MLGTSEFNLCCTQALLDTGGEICAMISMPEDARPNNSADVENFAKSNGIPYHDIENINSSQSLKLLSSYSTDYIFVSWPKILKEKILEIPINYCIGTHPTDIPFNRGRHPLHWLIALGISETKLSFLRMDKGVDTGDIILQVPFSISPDDLIGDVVNKMNTAAYEGTVRLHEKLLTNPSYSGIKQNHTLANYWRKRTPHDIVIDLRMSSDFILRTVQSFTLPYPCAKLIFENNVIKIISASPVHVEMRHEQIRRLEPGRIISINNNTIRVKVDDRIIALECVGKIPEMLLKAKYIHPPSKYISEHDIKLF